MRRYLTGSFAVSCSLAILARGAPTAVAGQADTKGSQAAQSEARRWFEDGKFGLSVPWGLYSLLGRGEWVMDKDKLPIAEYEKLPPQFNPTHFDADEWVALAQAAGARYITVTSKHHDGFCMFDSKLTSYDIVDATPYGQDPLQALSKACRKRGVKLFIYYSLLDWHHSDYYPLGRTGHTTGRAPKGDWNSYVAYYQGQIRELCSNYGEIAGLWLDGQWDRPDADWDLATTYQIIHTLQPGALVGNNHRGAALPGEDFQIIEPDTSGEARAGFDPDQVAQGLPKETVATLNGSRSYNADDTKFKSAKEIIHSLLGAAGRGSNLLLSVGPRPDGAIGFDAVVRLREVGNWLQKNGETLYATRKGPIPPQRWGVSLRSSNSVFLHVLKPGEPIAVPKSLQAFEPRLYGKHDIVPRIQTAIDFRLLVPEEAVTPIDTIIVLWPIFDGR